MILSPHIVSLVDRFGLDAAAIEAHTVAENRFHATGHGVHDPRGYAREVVATVRAASPADLDRCRATTARIRRELGI